MTYSERAVILAGKLGSHRALARQLGISHNALAYRIAGRCRIKAEYLLALEALEARLR